MSEDQEVLIEVPYGLRVADDCVHLTRHAREHEAMQIMLDLIVVDHPLSLVAEELTRRGYVSRSGEPFSQVDLFRLLPRLIEVAPEVFESSRWADLRAQRMR